MNKTIKHMADAKSQLALALPLSSVMALADAKHDDTIARQGNGGSAPARMARFGPNGEGNATT